MKFSRLFFIHLFFSSMLLSQTSVEYDWTKYYDPINNKIIGIWPHDIRYSDLSLLKELKYRWGFNNILLQEKRGFEDYKMILKAGYDSSKIMRHLTMDTYQKKVNEVPEMWAYYIDEPADRGENLTVWTSITDWIRNKYPNTQIVISGYKRDSFLKDFVNTIADHVMYSSYKHWWQVFGIWFSWPENPDQRSSWIDMKNIFGSKFSLTWVGAHKDLLEYDNLLGKAKDLGLNGVFLFQHRPHEEEVNDNNLESFSDAASKYGFLNKLYQQVRNLYMDGAFINKKFVGPTYLSLIPDTFDHSILTFENYTVTNNRIEDYFAETRIIAGAPYFYIIPESKNSSFNSYNEIRLKPGFHAVHGSVFRAYIGDE